MLVGSLMPLAALAGGLVGGLSLEVLRRKTKILMTAIAFIGAWLLLTYAEDVDIIYTGSATTEVFVGVVCLSLPVIKVLKNIGFINDVLAIY